MRDHEQVAAAEWPGLIQPLAHRSVGVCAAPHTPAELHPGICRRIDHVALVEQEQQIVDRDIASEPGLLGASPQPDQLQAAPDDPMIIKPIALAVAAPSALHAGGGPRTTNRQRRQVIAASAFIEVLILETDAGEMPANRAISRTPLPAMRNCLAFSTFGLVSGGRPNLIDRLLAAA